jgi:hypothetical protein
MNARDEPDRQEEEQGPVEPIEAQIGPDDIIDTEADDSDPEKDETQKGLSGNES